MVAHHFAPVTAFFPDGGTNFAVGGSISADLLQSEPEGFPAQIPTYLATTNGRAPANDLYFIWIGANDFAAAIDPSATVENIRRGIDLLSRAGARTFIVINLPDISLTPEVIAAGEATVQAAKQFVFTVNAALEANILPYAWSHGLHVDLVDINSLFTDVVLNPREFGFTNSADAAFNPSTGMVAPNPNDYVFWDGFHPTTKAHYIAAEFIYGTVALTPTFPATRSVPLARLGW